MKHYLLASAAAAVLAMPFSVQAQNASATQSSAGHTQGSAASPEKANSAASTSANSSQARVNECFGDTKAFDATMSERPSGYGMAGYGHGDALSSREATRIREAARSFANNGNVEACRMVLAELKETQGGGMKAWGTMGETDRNRMAEGYRERIKSAKPATELGAVRANMVIGADVRNPGGEDLGDVQDVLLGPDGKVQYVLIEHGGFVGVGEDLTPVRWKDVRIAPDFETVVINSTADALDKAPTVTSDNWGQHRDKWAHEADSYWDKALKS